MRLRRPIDRFMAKIRKVHGHWFWVGSIHPDGYGRFWLEGKVWPAHRASWVLANDGEHPGTRVIDHLCRYRRCVNPEHLEAVESSVNNLRGKSPTALKARALECSNGHPLWGDNVRVVYEKKPDGTRTPHRRCRECRREYGRRHYAKRKREGVLRDREDAGDPDAREVKAAEHPVAGADARRHDPDAAEDRIQGSVRGGPGLQV